MAAVVGVAEPVEERSWSDDAEELPLENLDGLEVDGIVSEVGMTLWPEHFSRLHLPRNRLGDRFAGALF